MQRRTALLGLMAVMGMALEGCARRHPVVAHRRRVRRRVRRRIRRRIRRRVAFRVITGRRVVVVPLAVAVGWELSLDTRVVVVREVRPATIVVVQQGGGGAPEEIEVAREDTPENTVEEQGSAIDAGDTATPGREVEEEVEEEVDA